MIKINKTDNIYDILEKISDSNYWEKISIEIPFWHKILYNYLSLKILKNKFKNKKILIITPDINAKKFWKNLWIKYTIIKNKWFIEDKNIIKYNYSFIEYFKYEIKKIFNNLKKLFFNNKKKNKIKLLYKSKNNIWLFILLLIIISTIFLYIFYFAVNNTYVEIKPEISVKNKSKNFIFKEAWSIDKLKDNEENLKVLEKTIYLEKNFFTTWIKWKENKRSRGKAEFINKNLVPYELIANTRLLSDDWLLYKITKNVKIPAWIKNADWEIIPWIKKIDIIAKMKDNSWYYIWKRWNKSWTWIILTIPWLKNSSNKLYVKTITPLKWWVDDYEKILAKNDLENAKKILEMDLKKEAIKKIKEEIKILNETNNVTYKILWIDDIYIFNKLDIQSPKIKVWDKIKLFKLKWTINIKSYAYNVNSVMSKLQSEIQKFIIPEKEKILLINKDSIRISNILYRKEKPFTVKATVTIEVFLSHNFEKENDSYVERLKSSIAWLNIEKAKKILNKESKINDVKITIVPFFINKVSNFPKNIHFKIIE